MTSSPRLAYDDLASIAEMQADARRAGAVLRLPSPLDRAALAAAARRAGTTKGPR